MNQKQIKIAARLLAVYFLDKVIDPRLSNENDVWSEIHEGRISRDDIQEIEGDLTDISQDLLGKDVRCGTVKEIIEYARKS